MPRPGYRAGSYAGKAAKETAKLLRDLQTPIVTWLNASREEEECICLLKKKYRKELPYETTLYERVRPFMLMYELDDAMYDGKKKRQCLNICQS